MSTFSLQQVQHFHYSKMLLPNVIDFSNKFFFRFSIYYFRFVQLLFVMFVPISEIEIYGAH